MGAIKAYKNVTHGEYEVYKGGYFNVDEICGNYNFVLGCAFDPEQVHNKKPGKSEYEIVKDHSHMRRSKS